MAIKQRLVLKLVPAEAPRERVLSPDELASDLESSGFQRVLKLTLPGRAVAHVHRSARLRDGSAGAKRGFQELFELGLRHSITLNRQVIFRIAFVVYVVWRIDENKICGIILLTYCQTA